MSGGHFEYKQYNLRMIADEIEQVVRDCGMTKEEHIKQGKSDNIFPISYDISESGYEYYGWHKESFPSWFIEEMKDIHDDLLVLESRVQRLDWVLSGDDGVKQYVPRLKEDLRKENGFLCATPRDYLRKLEQIDENDLPG